MVLNKCPNEMSPFPFIYDSERASELAHVDLPMSLQQYTNRIWREIEPEAATTRARKRHHQQQARSIAIYGTNASACTHATQTRHGNDRPNHIYTTTHSRNHAAAAVADAAITITRLRNASVAQTRHDRPQHGIRTHEHTHTQTPKMPSHACMCPQTVSHA